MQKNIRAWGNKSRLRERGSAIINPMTFPAEVTAADSELKDLIFFRRFAAFDSSAFDLILESSSLEGTADNAAIASWDDESGNDNDAVQVTSGDRPIYKWVITPSGRNVVRFNDDDFNLVSELNMPAGNNAVVIIAVLQTRVGSQANQSFISWGTRADNEMVAIESDQAGEVLNFSGYGNDVSAGAALTPGVFCVITGVWDQTTRYLRLDGVQVATGGFADKNTGVSLLKIGRPLNDGDGPFPGNFDLAALYIGSFKAAEIDLQLAEAYLTGKYITVPPAVEMAASLSMAFSVSASLAVSRNLAAQIDIAFTLTAVINRLVTLGSQIDFLFDFDAAADVVLPSGEVEFVSHSFVPYASHANTTITAPTGIVDGYLLVLFFGIGDPDSTPPAATPPAGFTLLNGFPAQREEGPSSFAVDFYIWYKICSGESGDYTVTHATMSTEAYIGLYSGADLTTPISPDVSIDIGPNGSPTTANAPSVTTPRDNCLVVMYAESWNFGAVTPPSGFTERLDDAGNLLWIGEKLYATAGATGDQTVTVNMSPWIAGLVSIQPALIASGDIAAQVDIAFILAGALAIERGLASTVAQSFGVTGALAVSKVFAAQFDAAFALSASLLVNRGLSAQFDSVFALSAALSKQAPLAAQMDIVFTMSADLSTGADLNASIAMSLTLAADLKQIHACAAQFDSAFTLAGSLAASLVFAAQVSISFTMSASMTVDRGLSAQIPMSITLSPAVSASLILAASVPIVFILEAILDGTPAPIEMQAVVSLNFSLTATLSVAKPLSASIPISLSLSPSLAGSIILGATMAPAFSLSANLRLAVGLAAGVNLSLSLSPNLTYQARLSALMAAMIDMDANLAIILTQADFLYADIKTYPAGIGDVKTHKGGIASNETTKGNIGS